MQSILRRGRPRVVSTVAALALALAGAGGALAAPAAAHDGVDHGAEPGVRGRPSTGPTTRRSRSPRTPVSRSTWRSCPTAGCCTPPATAMSGSPTRTPAPRRSSTRSRSTTTPRTACRPITLDPDFATNQWVYLYYAPRTMTAPYPTTTPTGSAPNTLPAGADASYWDQWKGYNQLTRVKWDAATGALDLATEQVILKVEVQRGQCCHVGGDVDFDDDGQPLPRRPATTRPASTPGANGFAPNNDAPGHEPRLRLASRRRQHQRPARQDPADQRRRPTAATRSPTGNLFAARHRADPSRDLRDGRCATRSASTSTPRPTRSRWGDYGPDAGAPNPDRGPMGYVEWQTTAIDNADQRAAGPTARATSSTTTSGTSRRRPRARSSTAPPAPRTTRAGTPVWTPSRRRPPATLYYGDNNTHQPWPELTDFSPAGGQGPMGGPVYHFDADEPVDDEVPRVLGRQGVLRRVLAGLPRGVRRPLAQRSRGPHRATSCPTPRSRPTARPITDSPIDIEFGPDGSLYVLDYGDGFFRANPDAGLYRIDYSPGNKAPTAAHLGRPDLEQRRAADRRLRRLGLDRPRGRRAHLRVGLHGDGTFDATGVDASHTYTTLGQVHRCACGSPTRRAGSASRARRSASATSHRPSTSAPGQRRRSSTGARPCRSTVTTTDPEDGTTTACARVDLDLRSRPRRPRPPAEPGHGMPVRDPDPGRRDPAR